MGDTAATRRLQVQIIALRIAINTDMECVNYLRRGNPNQDTSALQAEIDEMRAVLKDNQEELGP